MKSRILFAGAAALALAACGSAEDEPAGTATDASQMPGGMAGAETDPMAATPAAEPGMPANSQEFAAMAAASDMYEIEAGKLAQEKGQAQAVKDFGALMEREHTKSTADLKTAAGQAQGVTVNPQLSSRQQADLAALRNAGSNFDSLYAGQQVAAHEQALEMLRGYANNGEAQPLKDFAAKTAPVVEKHLAEARELP